MSTIQARRRRVNDGPQQPGNHGQTRGQMWVVQTFRELRGVFLFCFAVFRLFFSIFCFCSLMIERGGDVFEQLHSAGR